MRSGGAAFIATLPFILLTLGIGAVDVLTGYEMSEIALYPIPAIFAAWRLGYGAAIGLCLLAAATWYVAKWMTRPEDVTHGMILWNALQRLAIFICVAFFVVQIRSMKLRQARLLASDGLTGLQTRQGFLRDAVEALNAARQTGAPAALVMLDIDGLRSLNARLGQQRGDMILLALARAAWTGHRPTDLVCRLGADDFAILMIGLAPAHAAERVALIRKTLSENPAVTSDGVSIRTALITCENGPPSVEALLQAGEDALAQAAVNGRGAHVARAM